MTYSSIGIIALLVQLIINYDVLRKSAADDIIPAHRSYRKFLLGVIAYYITDILWGILDSFHLIGPLYADTVVYYIAMALSVFLWTKYVIVFLNEDTRIGKLIKTTGTLFFIMEMIVLAVNLFVPILFRFNEKGVYEAGIVRHIMLIVQMMLFISMSVYTLILGRKKDERKQLRYRTIGFFGVEMILLVAVQLYFPLLPLYSVGYLLGTCLLHTFVLEDEKAEYRKTLEDILRREQKHKQELGSARHLAYTDPLTGIWNKHAYLEATERLDMGINDGTVTEFGVIVCDLNGLKNINDTLGHEEGDNYIKNGCMLICDKFPNSPVYRIGGDEFAVLLEGRDYADRNALLLELDRQIEGNLLSGSVVVSTGIDVFSPERDSSFSAVFERADKKMYERKRFLKSIRADI